MTDAYGRRGDGITASPPSGGSVEGPPRARWSDLWKAPLHDFPLRDEILYHYLSLSGAARVLEVGPGSGFTAFRLARRVPRIVLLEVAGESIEDLRHNLLEVAGVTVVHDDIARPGLLDRLGGGFDAAFALDVFEYVVDPAACLENLAAVLRPGGELLLSYPNVLPPAGDGVTYFTRAGDLAALLERAGFTRWSIHAVEFRPWARVTYILLHEVPLGLYRRLRASQRGDRPQTYENTWAFRNRRRLGRYKIPLHLTWLFVAWVMRRGGPCFATCSVDDGIVGRQLVIRAWR